MTRVSPRRSRSVRALRLRAVLAGGLVLGVGAAVTLASWTDNEFATGSFASSVFNTQSSVNGSAYADNNVSPGPTVSLAGPFAPGVSSYFPVLIRTTANSVAGTVVLNGGILGGADSATLGAALVYRVVSTTGTCNAAAFTGTPPFVVGAAGTTRALTAGQEVGVTNTLAAASGATPGAATGFCFEVTLPASAPSTLQGKTATATWQFSATSS
ncbi:MAG: SipW-dependent-type signal peptide-containing protein [Leifsonia sp.]